MVEETVPNNHHYNSAWTKRWRISILRIERRWRYAPFSILRCCSSREPWVYGSGPPRFLPMQETSSKMPLSLHSLLSPSVGRHANALRQDLSKVWRWPESESGQSSRLSFVFSRAAHRHQHRWESLQPLP